MQRYWWILFLMVLLSACSDNGEVVKLLQEAEGYLPAQADSAEACLNRIPHSERLSGATGAWYGLLRTTVDNRQGRGVNNDSLIRSSYEYYRDASNMGQTIHHKLLRHYAQSCYYMGLYYASCDSTKECEDMYHQAIKSSGQCEDWHTCYLAYTQLSIRTRRSNPDYAIQQAKKALNIYQNIKDDVNNEVLILGHIGGCYLTTANPEKALGYYQRGYELAIKNHLYRSGNEMCMGMAGAYFQMGEKEKALSHAKSAIATAEGAVLPSSLISLAQCYQECDSLERAKDIYESINYHGTNPMNKYFVFKGLSEIAIQQQDMESLASYTDSVHESMEERFLQSQQEKDKYYQSNLTKELEKEKIQHEAERNKWVLGFIIFFLMLLSLFIYNVARNRIVMERQRRMNHIIAQRLENVQHLQEKKEKERVIAEHEKEIQYQNEIIRQKGFTLSVIQKHMLEKLDNYSQAISDNEKVKMTEETWKEIENLLDGTDDGFVYKLRKKYKNLTEEDIQLCMLIRLNMSNQVIANIYNIGVSAVKRRKLNLKKEGFHVTDPTIHIEEVIEKFCRFAIGKC